MLNTEFDIPNDTARALVSLNSAKLIDRKIRQVIIAVIGSTIRSPTVSTRSKEISEIRDMKVARIPRVTD
jgi:hypothetical protein